jgi:hypothetical protein
MNPQLMTREAKGMVSCRIAEDGCFLGGFLKVTNELTAQIR